MCCGVEIVEVGSVGGSVNASVAVSVAVSVSGSSVVGISLITGSKM